MDPCLGVYLLSPSISPRIDSPSIFHPSADDSPLVKSGQIAKSPSQPKDGAGSPQSLHIAGFGHSRIDSPVQTATHSQSDVKEDTAVVTVDDFLRRSTNRPARVFRRKRKRRIVDLREPQEVDTSNGSEGVEEKRNINSVERFRKRPRIGPTRQSRNQLESPPPGEARPHRRLRRRKASRTLADRLFRAAVLSHVDADQIVEEFHGPASGSLRRPLLFVKENNLSPKTPRISRKRRTLTLVDPRKVSPFHEAVFSSQHRGNVNSTNQRSSERREAQNTGHEKSQAKRKTQAKESPLCVSVCPPLSFVPLVSIGRVHADE